ncbi:hypothetical protein [Paractinoplanes toevensis]|uniref:Uncharacterized protein n=1 Tax=Paractinoplanes toevensis TaxID=571911 RepID=A0A919T3J5_9ACTN|nr:hypothetical protein [Actinoplanes toevensis]GIM88719.1 hypothetical protein Ato02nite_005120 [Actinoplanes toevensis]
MTERLDPYGTWGDWDLDRFKVEIVRWRDGSHPPDGIFDLVNRWWPRLEQPAERSGAVDISDDDPDGNLWWMWVPDAKWLDEEAGYFRVQCRFAVYELTRPPRLTCRQFRTVQSMTPADVDRADGMG